MNNIDNVIKEVLPRTKVYFDSIEEQFRYRERHHTKFEIFSALYGINIFLLAVTYFPILPFFLGKWDWLMSQTISFKIFEVSLHNFFIRWILLSAIFSALFFLIVRPIDDFLDKRKDKYLLSYRHLPFAFLYKAIKSLEIFIINGHSENTRKALNYLQWYYNRSFINTNIKLRTESVDTDLSVHLESLAEDNPWIEYTESTQKIIKAFKDFGEKINLRIEEKVEVDVCISVLEKLLVYEYLQLDKITKDQIDSIETNIADASKGLLLAVSDQLNNISIFEESKEPESSSGINKIENFFDGFAGVFNHKFILVTFFSWFLLLSVIVSGFVYFGIKTAGIMLDSTIFIGGVSIVILGAITLSATIFGKKKDTTTGKR